MKEKKIPIKKRVRTNVKDFIAVFSLRHELWKCPFIQFATWWMHSNKSTELDWLEAIFTHPWRKWKAFNELSTTEKKQNERRKKNCHFATWHTHNELRNLSLCNICADHGKPLRHWMNEWEKKNNGTNNTNWTSAVYECNLLLTGSLDGTYTQNLYANDTRLASNRKWYVSIQNDGSNFVSHKPSPTRVSESGLHFVIKIFDRCCLCK